MDPSIGIRPERGASTKSICATATYDVLMGGKKIPGRPSIGETPPTLATVKRVMLWMDLPAHRSEILAAVMLQPGFRPGPRSCTSRGPQGLKYGTKNGGTSYQLPMGTTSSTPRGGTASSDSRTLREGFSKWPANWERTFRTPFSYPNLGAPPVNRSRLREELALDLAGLLETVPIAVQYVLMPRFGSHK